MITFFTLEKPKQAFSQLQYVTVHSCDDLFFIDLYANEMVVGHLELQFS